MGQMPDMNISPFQQGGFYQDNQTQRNLNNRLKRIENYLGLRNEDKFDEDLYYNE